MKINIYVNDKFYKSMDLGARTKYDPKEITDMVQQDKQAGLLSEFDLTKGLGIRIEKVA